MRRAQKNMTNGTAQRLFVISRNAVFYHIIPHRVGNTAEYIRLNSASALSYVMTCTPIEPYCNFPPLLAHGILRLIPVSRNFTAHYLFKLNINAGFFQIAANLLALKSQLLFIAHMPQRTAAADFAYRTVRLDTTGRRFNQPFRLCISIIFTRL